jgi:hypothetical protein
MPLWGWLLTFLKGFIPVDGKRIGKILWVLTLCVLAIGIYHKVFVAKTTKIEKIENYYACPAEKDKLVAVSFNLWKLKFSLGL